MFDSYFQEHRGMVHFLRPHCEQDPKKPIMILTPHYTDDRFKHPQSVYLKKGYDTKRTYGGDSEIVECAFYVYSDRIFGWFTSEKIKEARRNALDLFPETRCVAHLEAYLRSLYDDPDLELVHVLAGYNLSTGFPYLVFGFFGGEK